MFRSVASRIVQCSRQVQCSSTVAAVRPRSFASIAKQSDGAELVVLDYDELVNPTPELHANIGRAFGYSGLGLLAVRGTDILSERLALLQQARSFAMLPKEVQQQYEHKESVYQIGWSHGKEMMSEGQPDFSKGSYYANPQYDDPVDGDSDLVAQFPSLLTPNLWPTKHLPDFETAFKGTGQLIIDVGQRLAAACDGYVASQLASYQPTTLHRIISETKTTKGRLLYYFPSDEEAASADSSEEPQWCGWHNDHGTLTGLTSAGYFDADGNMVPCPDDNAGLYIRTRDGETVRVTAPSDWLLFQIGESAQIHTGGVLQATPHSVQSASTPGVARATFAVFMQPWFHESMTPPEGVTRDDVLRGSSAKYLPPGVPALGSRWTQGERFSEFTAASVAAYHDMS